MLNLLDLIFILFLAFLMILKIYNLLQLIKYQILLLWNEYFTIVLISRDFKCVINKTLKVYDVIIS